MSDTQAQAPSTPPAKGTPEYDKAMADLFDSSQPKPEQPPTDEPKDLILGKFKSQADLEAAYKELEAKLGGAKAEHSAPKDKPADPPKGAEQDPKGSEQSPANPWEKASQELASDGELSEETLQALKASGTPESVIQSWIKSNADGAASYKAEMAKAAGGEEQFETIRKWASQALSSDEKKALQDLVASGDVVKARLAVETMKARYVAANGNPPVAPIGGKSPGASTAGYESVEQMIADMAKPEYKQDPAFREKVRRRVEVTTAF